MKLFKGVAYSRVSTMGQVLDESGLRREDSSIDTQERRIDDYLRTKNLESDEKQYKVIDYLRDEGLSGGSMKKRPAFQKMWNLITDRQVDFIITTELSRLSRSTVDFLNLMNHCNENNVMMFSLKEGFDPSSGPGKLLATITAVLGEFERESTIHRVRENAKSRLKVKGRINGSAPILGLIRSKEHKETYFVDEEERNRLIEILNIYLLSNGRGDALNIIRNKNLYDSGGKEFTYCRLNNLLFNVNWRYLGKWFLKDHRTKAIVEEIKLKHGALISDDLAKKVKEKLEREIKEKIRCGHRDKSYLLTGILFDKDGNTYHGTKGNSQYGDYYYYFCKESNVRINAEELEGLVLKNIAEYVKKDHKAIAVVDASCKRLSLEIEGKQEVLLNIKMEIKKIDREIEIQKSLLHVKNIDADAINLISSVVKDFNLKRNNLVDSQQVLMTELARLSKSYLTNEMQKKIEVISKSIYSADVRGKRKLIRSLYDRIIVLDKYEIQLIIKEASDSGALLFEVLPYRGRVKLDNLTYLKRLYLDEDMSLNELARKLSCSRNTIKRRLVSVGVDVHYKTKSYPRLKKRITELYSKGFTLQNIANKLNLWGVKTRSGEGKWHPKSINDLLNSSQP